jgi:diadenosine tetraphosphatase ApaH/serine/threonine PP2A family protein phosphatase
MKVKLVIVGGRCVSTTGLTRGLVPGLLLLTLLVSLLNLSRLMLRLDLRNGLTASFDMPTTKESAEIIPWDWENSTSEALALSKPYFQPEKLPLDSVHKAMEMFKQQKRIHPKYVFLLLEASTRYLAKQPNLDRISLQQNDTVTIVGDIHGKYYNLLHIFEMNGYPSPSNPYLFNGDMVDKGLFGIETIMTLLLFQLSCGIDCLRVNRGNHEFTKKGGGNSLNSWMYQVKTAYDDDMYQQFVNLFKQLPFAHVIQDQVFVVHAGLTNKQSSPGNMSQEPASLDDIAHIRKGVGGPSAYTLWSNLIWSDPMDADGMQRLHPGTTSRGMMFGPDVTERFLRENDLRYIIRSHQCRDGAGFHRTHGGKVITVFSAPSWCYTGQAAFVRLSLSRSSGSLEPEAVYFTEAPEPPTTMPEPPSTALLEPPSATMLSQLKEGNRSKEISETQQVDSRPRYSYGAPGFPDTLPRQETSNNGTPRYRYFVRYRAREP